MTSKMTEKANASVTDMTVGSPWKHILTFALPLLVGNVFQQLYNLVDSLVVGNCVGADAVAAVGACTSVGFLLNSISFGLSVGIGVIVAQHFGAKQEDSIRNAIANSVYVLGSVAIITTVLGYFFSSQILILLDTPDLVLQDAIVYLRTTCFGIIGVVMYNGIAAILRALGDSKTPLYFLIVSSIINVTLDLVFVICFGWGVFGVAFATVIAQIMSGLLCIIYAYFKVSYFKIPIKQFKPDMSMIKKQFVTGIPLTLQNSMIAISCMALQSVVNSFGPNVMSAFMIVGRIEQIVQQPFGSLGAALTAYSGQNMGAGDLARVKKGYRVAVVMVLIFSLVLIAPAYLFGEQIIGAFVKKEEVEVIALGVEALKVNSLCYFGLGMIYVPRAVLNGCGDTGFAMLNGITEVCCRILFSQFLTRIPGIGYFGLWITTGATWVTTAIICAIRYYSGRWKKKKLV